MLRAGQNIIQNIIPEVEKLLVEYPAAQSKINLRKELANRSPSLSVA